MSYSIKQLAELSGVSTRTLRFYDEIGLLKPSFIGENQYRYYEDEQVILLQQILFYRELDYSLKDIKKVLNHSAFDKVSSLQQQKMLLQKKQDSISQMLKTIDKTINHCRGEISMQVEEFFDSNKLQNRKIQKQYEDYLVGKGILSKEDMNASWLKIANWTQADWDKFKGDGDAFYQKMRDAIDEGLTPDDEKVLALVDKHYLVIKPLWPFNQDSYIKLADAYEVDDNFRKFCELYHVKLCSFLVKAMKAYAFKNLK